MITGLRFFASQADQIKAFQTNFKLQSTVGYRRGIDKLRDLEKFKKYRTLKLVLFCPS
jgi:hypothetical protein